MHWDDALGHLFEDLEQQAEGLRLADRDAEIAERIVAEYAEVDLASRLHASAGSVIWLDVLGTGAVGGNLARIGRDWCLLEGTAGLGGAGQEWIIRLDAVRRAQGLSDRAVSEPARGVATRLGLGSALRTVGESRAPVVVHHLDGAQTTGVLARVGADFVEIRPAGTDGESRRGAVPTDLVPFAALGGAHPI